MSGSAQSSSGENRSAAGSAHAAVSGELEVLLAVRGREPRQRVQLAHHQADPRHHPGEAADPSLALLPTRTWCLPRPGAWRHRRASDARHRRAAVVRSRVGPLSTPGLTRGRPPRGRTLERVDGGARLGWRDCAGLPAALLLALGAVELAPRWAPTAGSRPWAWRRSPALALVFRRTHALVGGAAVGHPADGHPADRHPDGRGGHADPLLHPRRSTAWAATSSGTAGWWRWR